MRAASSIFQGSVMKNLTILLVAMSVAVRVISNRLTRFFAITVAVFSMSIVSAHAQAQPAPDYHLVDEWVVSTVPKTVPDNGLASTIRLTVIANPNLALISSGLPAITLSKQADGTFRGSLPNGQHIIVWADPVYGLVVDVYRGQWTRNYYIKNGTGSSVALGLELANAKVIQSAFSIVGNGAEKYTFTLLDGTVLNFSSSDFWQVINTVWMPAPYNKKPFNFVEDVSNRSAP
jgi:hypothetical protein